MKNAVNISSIFSDTLKSEDTLPFELGERLYRLGFLTDDQLRIARHEQRQTGKQLATILVDLEFIDEIGLAEILAARNGCRFIMLDDYSPDADLMRYLPRELAHRYCAVPLGMNTETLDIAIADPDDIASLDGIRRYFPHHLETIVHVATPADIRAVIDRYLNATAVLEDILHELEGSPDKKNMSSAGSEDWQHPVVRLVDSILEDAARRGASDIHIEPEDNMIRIRLRIDGVLEQLRALHRGTWSELSHRLKILAGVDIAETRAIQDGRFRQTISGIEMDFRVSVMPTARGENIVIRLLDPRQAQKPLDALGFNSHHLESLERIVNRPEGLVLVTGPTGSGKTTTLYGLLNRVNQMGVNIMTLEEPIEYHFPLMRQTAVSDTQGMGFAEGVRGLLRQDPDVILIGEIRDNETARMAMRAVMTGHQVFATLHTGDALGVLPRLNDFGIAPELVAEHLSGIIAQRLVRILCPSCKRPRRPSEHEQKLFTSDQPVLVADPVGCPSCRNTGYRGRMAVAEILMPTPQLIEAIHARAPRPVLETIAKENGFRSMAMDGLDKMRTQLTSFEELRRILDLET